MAVPGLAEAVPFAGSPWAPGSRSRAASPAGAHKAGTRWHLLGLTEEKTNFTEKKKKIRGFATFGLSARMDLLQGEQGKEGDGEPSGGKATGWHRVMD